MEAFELIIHFKSPTMTTREYINFSKDILKQLSEFDPIFKNLFGWGTKPNARKQIASDLSDFDEIVFKQLADFDEIAYENPDPNDKESGWDSKCFIGYGNSYSNTARIKEGQITVSIDAGKDIKTGVLIIKFPQYHFPQYNDYSHIKMLFLKCIKMLKHVYYGCVISDEIWEFNNSKTNEIDIGWFTFLPQKNIMEMLPDDIYKEEVENGTLFTLSKDPADSNVNMEKKVKKIRKSLTKIRLLNKSY
jgi:hypothetical protein